MHMGPGLMDSLANRDRGYQLLTSFAHHAYGPRTYGFFSRSRLGAVSPLTWFALQAYGPRTCGLLQVLMLMCSDTTQAKILCTCKNHMLSVSGFRCWQLQVPLRGHRDGSGWAWEPVTLQCTPFWSCPAAIPLFLAGTGYKVLFPCCTASLKKLSPGSFFQLDNNDGTFMECFQWLKALYNWIKEKHGMHKYTHTEKQTWWHNNTVIKWWTTPVHAKQYETHIYIYA